MIEQSAEIAKAIQERSKKELREVIVEVLHREPTEMEWEIAASSFYILISRANYDEAMSGSSILSSLRISLCALVISVRMCPYLPV